LGLSVAGKRGLADSMPAALKLSLYELICVFYNMTFSFSPFPFNPAVFVQFLIPELRTPNYFFFSYLLMSVSFSP